MDQIELIEETDRYLAKDELSDLQALALYRDPRFEFEWPNLVRWLRLSEQNFRVDKWSLCRG
jgi:hypothetical protein